MTRATIPAALGSAMAALMVALLHPMPDGWPAAGAALAFALSHLVLLASALALGLLVPRLRAALLHHRPSLPHMAAMVCGMAGTSLALHLALHGGIA